MDHSGWCPHHAVSMDWIERRALDHLENSIEPDSVYMSNDVYVDFMKSMSRNVLFSNGKLSNGSGVQIARIITSAGELTIKRVALLSNFCYVGTQTSAERLVWEKVSMEFEDAFFGGEDET